MVDAALSNFAGVSGIGPVLIMAATALLLLVLDIFMRVVTKSRRGLPELAHLIVFLLGTAAAGIDAAMLMARVKASGGVGKAIQLFPAQGFLDADHQKPFWTGGAVHIDHYALIVCMVISAVLILGSLILAPFLKQRGLFKPEVYPLLAISGSGMMLLGFSHDMLVTFIAIEVLSLPLYVLCGLDNRSQAGRESSLKYFLLGAFASGFFIYGCAFVYGVCGNLNYAAISFFLRNTLELKGILLLGFLLIGVGLAFKIALVPFHAWVPDVYQGAPTPVTAIMAAGVKIGVFVAAQRIIHTCLLYSPPEVWQNGLGIFAVASMIVGNLMALHQMSLKRLLAYSAITHTGYLAVGLCAANGNSSASTLIYLVSYALAAVGAFGLITYLSPAGQDDVYLDEMHELFRRSPLASLALVIMLLSMAGFPLTAGFIGKLMVFMDAWRSELYGLVILALINSVVSAYFYLRVVMAMYLQPKVPGASTLEPGRIPPGLAFAGVVSVVMTLVLGFLPQVLIDLAGHSLP